MFRSIPGPVINLRLQKIRAMEVLTAYLGGWRGSHRPLELSDSPARQPEIAQNHRLVPRHFTLIDPPCSCGIIVTCPSRNRSRISREQAKGALVPALCQRTGLPDEEQRLDLRREPVTPSSTERAIWSASLGRP
jgi:hypothetical protein